MENPRILKQRWSLTFKLQIIASASALLIMIGVPVLGELLLDPQGKLYNALFWYGFWLKGPAMAIIRVLGMDERLSPFAHDVFVLGLNTLFVFCAVGFIGKAVSFTKSKIKNRSQ